MTELDPNEHDPVRLWAEIWRLREAVKGPDGYDTWQEAATAERLRRVRAEAAVSEQWKCECGANLFIDADGAPRSKAVPADDQQEMTRIVEDLQNAVPVLMVCIEKARVDYPEATIKLFGAAENPDGSGKFAGKFDIDLIEDVAKLIGFKGATPEDQARYFLSKHGLLGRS